MAFLLRKVFFFIGFTLFLMMALPVYAANYYVATTGNDANSGTQSQPWKTISKAAGVASAGDTVYVRGGTYQEQVNFARSGTATAPIKLMAYPGETPVIDGNNYTLATNWGVLLNLSGDFVQASGFEVRYSGGMGVLLSGKNDLASSVNSNHNQQNGILITGDSGIVENSQAWSNCMSNVNGSSTSGWASGLSAARHPNNAVIRKNIVYGNWGEGLSTYEANGTIIEDNVVYDNFTNIYISDATNVLCQRNLVYATGTIMTVGAQVGIMLGDEKYNPASSDITIINNLVVNTNRNFYWWQGLQGGGLKNVLVAHNTFVNSADINCFQINSGPHQNVRVENNIIEQDDSLPVALVPSSTGLTFSNNLWSKTPPSNVSSSTDVIGDPKLAKTGSIQPGTLTAEWFKLLASSPAINKAVVLSEVSSDYFSNPRGSTPDIGAHEFIGATITPTSTPTLTPQIPGDVNHDGHVNLADYTLFIPNYGTSDVNCDFNKNGLVDMGDYSLLVENYGKF